MAMIIYKKMSLFDAPEGSIIMHGCNAQGVWGSGIAAPFKEKYPRSFKEYNKFCEEWLRQIPYYGAVGKFLLCSQENKRFVGCLVTSFDYGKNRDNPSTIITQTVLALEDFMKDYAKSWTKKPLYCNRFNSGMFKVPWLQTEAVLQYFSTRYEFDVIVCDPDLIEEPLHEKYDSRFSGG